MKEFGNGKKSPYKQGQFTRDSKLTTKATVEDELNWKDKFKHIQSNDKEKNSEINIPREQYSRHQVQKGYIKNGIFLQRT